MTPPMQHRINLGVIAATAIIPVPMLAVSNGVHPIILLAPAIALVLTSWPWVFGAPAVANALSSQGIGFAGIALASTPQQALMMSGFGVDTYAWSAP